MGSHFVVQEGLKVAASMRRRALHESSFRNLSWTKSSLIALTIARAVAALHATANQLIQSLAPYETEHQVFKKGRNV